MGKAENEVGRTIEAISEARGCKAIRVNSGFRVMVDGQGKKHFVRGAKKGTADYVVCLRPRGRFLALEVKAPGIPGLRPDGRSTAAQEAFADEIAAIGGVAAVVWDGAGYDAILDRLGVPKIGQWR